MSRFLVAMALAVSLSSCPGTDLRGSSAGSALSGDADSAIGIVYRVRNAGGTGAFPTVLASLSYTAPGGAAAVLGSVSLPWELELDFEFGDQLSLDAANPAVTLATGTTTGSGLNQLIAAAGGFTSVADLALGDWAVNTGSSAQAAIGEIFDGQLNLKNHVFTAGGQAYALRRNQRVYVEILRRESDGRLTYLNRRSVEAPAVVSSPINVLAY